LSVGFEAAPERHHCGFVLRRRGAHEKVVGQAQAVCGLY
jgi:hypothetical protein